MGAAQSGATKLQLRCEHYIVPDPFPSDVWISLSRVLRYNCHDVKDKLDDSQQHLFGAWAWQIIRETRGPKQQFRCPLPTGADATFKEAATAVFDGYGEIEGDELVLTPASPGEARALELSRCDFNRRDLGRRQMIMLLCDLALLAYELDQDYLEGDDAAAQWELISPRGNRPRGNLQSMAEGQKRWKKEKKQQDEDGDSSHDELLDTVTSRLTSRGIKTMCESAQHRGVDPGAKQVTEPVSDTTLIEFRRTKEGLQVAVLKSESTKHLFVIFRGTGEYKEVLKDTKGWNSKIDAYQNPGTCCAAAGEDPHKLRGLAPRIQKRFFIQYASGMHAQGDHRPLSAADPAGVLKTVLDHFSDADDGWRLLVAGHSLGGALATLFTVDVARRTALKNIFCATFGSPRVGNADFQAEFDMLQEQGRVECFRCQFEADIVSRVPSVGFEHVGTHVWLGGGDFVQVRNAGTLCSAWTPSCDPCRVRPFGYGAKDHGMTNYVAALQDTNKRWDDMRAARPTSFDVVLRECFEDRSPKPMREVEPEKVDDGDETSVDR
eukprot:Hpha_TRINITY_DN30511_c0_g1::TRINITY_DN30511_c0_g1_i1::g.193627::m.193627